ncbi:MAG: 23S rRNA (guanosine(2251)-2'-O)-methyltransferase RlmB [Ruminococcus sp.]|jgi:23S rRNA (guanosine2251-2'-O)-methyltransferase|nr:23S rRNA (guanosine(2251)-2'-O)-methyltransferase RlmB [Ruminococcus sp.]
MGSYTNVEQNTDDMIIGRNPVLEALKAEREIDILYIAPSERGLTGILGVIAARAREAGIPVKTVDERKLSDMTGGMSHQGVIATAAQTHYLELDELLAIPAKNPLYIAAAGIEDPHNLGAIIRTAEAVGAAGIIIPKRRNVSVNATVYKTSAGAAAVLPVCRVGNLASAIDTLKDNGVWVYGADMNGESLYKTSLSGSLCIVIGAEGSGIPPLIRKKCDGLLKIPMFGQINSLNASVAAGIIMYEIRRQGL